ncbi:MAG: VWA domain-containing protein [Chloroflexi bacterium]|nr:VWA domain-containing protein [Chloroflexota bacterium]
MFIARKLLVLLLLMSLAIVACSEEDSDSNNGGGFSEDETLRIVSGSENEALEPILQRFARENNVSIQIDYLGSLDIRLMLEEQGASMEYDAVWPANSLWLTLGDTQNVLKHEQSIMRSPVVLGIKTSVAQDLGWIDVDVTVDDILSAAEDRNLRLMMTSATQSNSGASAYFGYLYALSGTEGILTSEDLNDPTLAEKIRRILSTIDRSSGSSGWLKELYLEEYENFDGMVNYEALVIEMNRELIARGDEPLYAIYPVDGLAIADSPLAFVDKGSDAKEKIFLDLQTYLLSDPVRQEILDLGRRATDVGIRLDPDQVDPSVFNQEWGIDVTRVIQPIDFPAPQVITEALNLYQTAFRKPSFTIYCLDYSGSMRGQGEAQLEEAMSVLLDQDLAQRYLLQASPRDITIVIPFNSGIIATWPRVIGNDRRELTQLMQRIISRSPDGGTNIYAPVAYALRLMEEETLEGYFPAIILMSDGESNEGSIAEIEQAIADTGLDNVPVFGITFGAASEAQLNEIAILTSGRVYDGTTDLITAFRKAKGNN